MTIIVFCLIWIIIIIIIMNLNHRARLCTPIVTGCGGTFPHSAVIYAYHIYHTVTAAAAENSTDSSGGRNSEAAIPI